MNLETELKSIEGIQIRENTITILVTSGKDYYYTKGSEMRNYIKNFEEVKEKLLKLCDDWYGCQK